MNHGYDDDDDGASPPCDPNAFPTPSFSPPLPRPAVATDQSFADIADEFIPPVARAGPSGGLLAQLMGGGGFGGMGMGMGMTLGHEMPARAYDEYYKAYSVAMMNIRERPELLYGGKIVMPPSALAKLSQLDIASPWTFHLRNPRNPTVHQTHAGVLEFIADEGIVHLPAWMMKTLNLNEGDPIRITGTKLPKGKFVKIQAQTVDFLDVHDAKAVLESALRFYSCLSKGDIIEITYNSLTFEFLIMETQPEGIGISVLDTDLEVDFAPPVGYVEPERPAPAPIPTMADKLKIDLGETTPVGSLTSRPGSVASNRPGSGDATPVESFTGIGNSLSGKKVRGKGLARKIEEVDSSSKINRAEGPRVFTPDSIADRDRKVPAALKLPAGKFFFGYKYVPFDPTKAPKKIDPDAIAGPSSFSGAGNTLKPSKASSSATNGSGGNSLKRSLPDEEKEDPWAKLSGGNVLRSGKAVAGGGVSTNGTTAAASGATAAAAASAPAAPERDIIDATMLSDDDFMFPDGYDDEDDDDGVIEIDSD